MRGVDLILMERGSPRCFGMSRSPLFLGIGFSSAERVALLAHQSAAVQRCKPQLACYVISKYSTTIGSERNRGLSILTRIGDAI
jgi:hypothetical protein